MAIKVVHVCTVGVTALRLLLPQCRFLQRQGFDVSFVFSPGPDAELVRRQGFVVHEVYIDRQIKVIRDLKSIVDLEHCFRKIKPAIVHTHTSKAGIAGRLAAARARVPGIIHTIHGFPFHPGMNPLKYLTYVQLERLAARYTTVLLSQSLEDVKTARSLGIEPTSGKVVWIGNGVDVTRFDPRRFSREARRQIRKDLGVKDEEVIITTIGRVNREKGYEDLLLAAARLQGPWRLLCIGEDEGYLEKARDLSRRLGVEGRVWFLGRRSDVDRILAISDIFVLASHREGVPRSVIEAQAMGLPCVVTNIRGSREIVVDKETGLIAPVRNPEALARAIQELIDSAELRSELGKNGRRRVEQNFSEELVFTRILNAYKEVLSMIPRSE